MKNSAIILVLLAPSIMTNAWGFGFDGSSGRDGMSGMNGRDGQSVTIDADGSFRELNLSGTDGSNGADGFDGRAAGGCYFSPGPADEWGASGGQGGDGGDGGQGGNAGDLIVYFSSLEQLRNIRVLAVPGEGGLPGVGGYGGEGCRCHVRNWDYRRCGYVYHNGEQRYECRNEYHSCFDGRSGRNGYRGALGSSGRTGDVYLISQTEHLSEVSPQTALDLSHAGEEAALTENLWEGIGGVSKFFAAGSILSDRAYWYNGQGVARVTLRWASKRAKEEFAGFSVRVRLAQGQVTFTNPSGVLLSTERSVENGLHVLTIRDALFQREVDQVQISSVAGKGKNLVLNLVDPSQVLEAGRTTLSLVFDSKGKCRFQGTVSESSIQRGEKKLVLQVGKVVSQSLSEKCLKPRRMLFFKVSRKIRLQVGIQRQFGLGDESFTVRRSTDYKIR